MYANIIHLTPKTKRLDWGKGLKWLPGFRILCEIHQVKLQADHEWLDMHTLIFRATSKKLTQ